jgi:hypothetical protein
VLALAELYEAELAGASAPKGVKKLGFLTLIFSDDFEVDLLAHLTIRSC